MGGRKVSVENEYEIVQRGLACSLGRGGNKSVNCSGCREGVRGIRREYDGCIAALTAVAGDMAPGMERMLILEILWRFQGVEEGLRAFEQGMSEEAVKVMET